MWSLLPELLQQTKPRKGRFARRFEKKGCRENHGFWCIMLVLQENTPNSENKRLANQLFWGDTLSNTSWGPEDSCRGCVFLSSEVSKRGWREVGWRLTNPQKQAKKFSRNVFPFKGHRKKSAEKEASIWRRRVCAKNLLAPTPSVRQPLLKTSD